MEKEVGLKKEIEAIDSKMAGLFQKRMDIVKRIGDVPIYSDLRENYLVDKLSDPITDECYDYFVRFQQNLFELTDDYQNDLLGKADGFLKGCADYSPNKEVAFELSSQANKEREIFGDKVINATLGSLYDEQHNIITFSSVYDSYNDIANSTKARYASSVLGNPDFNREVFNWINKDNNIKLNYGVCATSGGTGALTLAFNDFLNDNETILLPKVGWSAYRVMAKQANLKFETYDLVNDNNEVDITSIIRQAIYIMKRQRKLVVVINDPCQNPTGISLKNEDWAKLIAFFNKISEFGKVIVINDIAYLDFSNNPSNRQYMTNFNNITNNVMIELAFSCSKTFTAYGMRTGAAVILHQSKDEIDRIMNAFAKTARSYWSNVNNGFMNCFVDVMANHKEEYISQLENSVDLLAQRAEIFINKAKEVGLPIYPYSEGFFVLIKINDSIHLDKYYKALLDNHIYGLKWTGGVRIAICSLNKKECEVLPSLLMKILKECK